MKNTTTWNDLAQLSIGGDIQEADFNEVVGKAGFDVGMHTDLTIASVEPIVSKGKDGNSYVRISIGLENSHGNKIFTSVFPIDKDSGGMSKRLRGLLSSLTQDKGLLVKFGSMIKSDLSNLAALVGMKTSVLVGPPKQGTEIVLVDGAVTVRDVPTGEVYKTFTNFAAAQTYLKENGYRRAYNEIEAFKPGSENAETLTRIIEASKPITKPVSIRRQAL
jgi:hypothetical protein